MSNTALAEQCRLVHLVLTEDSYFEMVNYKKLLLALRQTLSDEIARIERTEERY